MECVEESRAIENDDAEITDKMEVDTISSQERIDDLELDPLVYECCLNEVCSCECANCGSPGCDVKICRELLAVTTKCSSSEIPVSLSGRETIEYLDGGCGDTGSEEEGVEHFAVEALMYGDGKTRDGVNSISARFTC